ncbi:MAG TPA: hypothetical protein VII06_04565 [Chloroflexota bacterium]
MAAEPQTIKVTGDVRVADLLEQADKAPLVLENNGVRYRLSREDQEEDIWAGYDPEKARAALDETIGSWADLDVDAIIENVYRWRREGSRPPDRPSWPT